MDVCVISEAAGGGHYVEACNAPARPVYVANATAVTLPPAYSQEVSALTVPCLLSPICTPLLYHVCTLCTLSSLFALCSIGCVLCSLFSFCPALCSLFP